MNDDIKKILDDVEEAVLNLEDLYRSTPKMARLTNTDSKNLAKIANKQREAAILSEKIRREWYGV